MNKVQGQLGLVNPQGAIAEVMLDAEEKTYTDEKQYAVRYPVLSSQPEALLSLLRPVFLISVYLAGSSEGPLIT